MRNNVKNSIDISRKWQYYIKYNYNLNSKFYLLIFKSLKSPKKVEKERKNTKDKIEYHILLLNKH